MHLVLTDLLTCPVCGRGQGLIVFNQRMQDRRILEGALGCPNCETQYPIQNGLADLLLPGSEATWEVQAPLAGRDGARLAALLGLTEGRGFALLLGVSADAAAQLARVVPNLELVVSGQGAADAQEERGVNRLRCSAEVPLRDGSMRGVVALTAVDVASIGSLVRLLSPGARLVVCSAHENEALERLGLRVLARDANTVVALRVQ